MGYDVNQLKDILQMDQSTLKNYLELQLEDKGYKPINKKGFLYAEGDIPVLLVAHLARENLNKIMNVKKEHFLWKTPFLT